jgi:hypothetical protein
MSPLLLVLIAGTMFLPGCAPSAVPAEITSGSSSSGVVSGSFTVADGIAEVAPIPKPETPTQPTLILTRTEYISVPTTVYVPTWKEPRQFRDGDELRDYLSGAPVLIAAWDGADCDDVARLFMRRALKDGYWVSLQYLPYWPKVGGEHMLNLVLTDDNSMYYVEPQTNEYWWISPID